jgi:non-canonical poly(A) RNA polymerase PAPD5/7
VTHVALSCSETTNFISLRQDMPSSAHFEAVHCSLTMGVFDRKPQGSKRPSKKKQKQQGNKKRSAAEASAKDDGALRDASAESVGKAEEQDEQASSKTQREEDWKDADFLSLDGIKPRTRIDKKQEESADDASEHESDMETSSSSVGDGADTLPPWMNHYIDVGVTHPLIALHNEIVGFARLMEPTREEMDEREELIGRIRRFVNRTFKGTVMMEVFGSQCTGLFLPTSDIDLVLTSASNGSEIKEGEEGSAEYIMDAFAAALRSEWITELSYLEVLSSARIPLVKFTHAPSNISVDVSFNQPFGPQAASLLLTFMDALPPLRPLTFVLKHFLAARDLNKPFTGGMGSYMLQLLIVSFLQHQQREFHNYGRDVWPNLGSLLLDFFRLYGLEFNYYTTGKC